MTNRECNDLSNFLVGEALGFGLKHRSRGMFLDGLGKAWGSCMDRMAVRASRAGPGQGRERQGRGRAKRGFPEEKFQLGQAVSLGMGDNSKGLSTPDQRKMGARCEVTKSNNADFFVPHNQSATFRG